MEHRDNGSAGLDGSADEALSAAELDILIHRVVDVHASNAVHNNGAGTILQTLLQVLRSRIHTAQPFGDDAREGDVEVARCREKLRMSGRDYGQRGWGACGRIGGEQNQTHRKTAQSYG